MIYKIIYSRSLFSHHIRKHHKYASPQFQDLMHSFFVKDKIWIRKLVKSNPSQNIWTDTLIKTQIANKYMEERSNILAIKSFKLVNLNHVWQHCDTF